MNQSLSCPLRPQVAFVLALGFGFGVWCATIRANDVANSVTVSSTTPPPAVGFNEGGGDGLNWTATTDTKRLKLTLNAPVGDQMKCDGQTVISEGIAWDCPDWDQCAPSHIYTSALITPKDFFRPLFSGKICAKQLAAKGAGEKKEPTWKAGVIQADIQGDADNDSTASQRPPSSVAAERTEEEVAEQAGASSITGLIVPLNANYDELSASAPPKLDADEPGVAVADAELVQCKLVLNLPDEVKPGSKVKLTYQDANFVVYKLTGSTTTKIDSGAQYDVPTFGTDNVLLFEGISPSARSGDNNIVVTLTPASGDVARDRLILTVASLDMDIYRGGGWIGDNLSTAQTRIPGVQVPESQSPKDPLNPLVKNTLEDEEALGAFCVANLNDTDAKDGPDGSHGNVEGTNSHGSDEMDLMQLTLRRPLPADLPGDVRVMVAAGTVHFYLNATKKGAEITGGKLIRAVSTIASDFDWYVEARAATALRGIKIKFQYRTSSTRPWLNASGPGDSVAATAIWFESAAPPGHQPLESHARGPTALNMWFRVTPNDIMDGTKSPEKYGDGTRCRPWFDMSRQRQGPAFYWFPNAPRRINSPPVMFGPTNRGMPENAHFPMNLPDGHFRSHNEWANDDLWGSNSNGVGGNWQEDEPDADGYIWSGDAPGPARAIPPGGLYRMHMTFREFVRVRFDNDDPTEGVEWVNAGTRCSEYVPWHAIWEEGLVLKQAFWAPGHELFARKALHTSAVAAAVPGTRHHAVCRGMDIAAGPGAANPPQIVLVDVLESDGPAIHAPIHAGVPAIAVGRVDANNAPLLLVRPGNPLDQTQPGDHVAYTAVGYFASGLDGTIVGPSGSGGDVVAELFHKNVAGAGRSPIKRVTGTAVTQPAPTIPGGVMVRGTITPVVITHAYVASSANGRGRQTFGVRVVDADGGFTFSDTLDTIRVTITRQLTDEHSGGPANAILGAALKFSNSSGRIAARKVGTVIGPVGTSYETTAQLTYEVAGNGLWATKLPVTGPVYTMKAPVIGKTRIPIGKTSEVKVEDIFIEATGAVGPETFNVRIIDADTWLDPDDPLDEIVGVEIQRPAGCFPKALIGPTSAKGTLTNPAPGGEVRGPLGGSAESTAQITYEIGPSTEQAPTVPVTALK